MEIAVSNIILALQNEVNESNLDLKPFYSQLPDGLKELIKYLEHNPDNIPDVIKLQISGPYEYCPKHLDI